MHWKKWKKNRTNKSWVELPVKAITNYNAMFRFQFAFFFLHWIKQRRGYDTQAICLLLLFHSVFLCLFSEFSWFFTQKKGKTGTRKIVASEKRSADQKPCGSAGCLLNELPIKTKQFFLIYRRFFIFDWVDEVWKICGCFFLMQPCDIKHMKLPVPWVQLWISD